MQADTGDYYISFTGTSLNNRAESYLGLVIGDERLRFYCATMSREVSVYFDRRNLKEIITKLQSFQESMDANQI